MSLSIALQGVQDASVMKPLDEAVWQAWVRKGRGREWQYNAARMTAIKWASIVGLLAAAALWSDFTRYEIVVRFIVSAGAMVVMAKAFDARRYVVASVFGTLALLYNPVLPVFSFSGDWQRAVVVASTLPFASSLAWHSARPGPQD